MLPAIWWIQNHSFSHQKLGLYLIGLLHCHIITLTIQSINYRQENASTSCSPSKTGSDDIFDFTIVFRIPRNPHPVKTAWINQLRVGKCCHFLFLARSNFWRFCPVPHLPWKWTHFYKDTNFCMVYNNSSNRWSCHEIRWFKSRYISVYECMTSVIIADCERWKLSTMEYHLFWSAKQYLLGIKMYLKTTQKWTVTLNWKSGSGGTVVKG